MGDTEKGFGLGLGIGCGLIAAFALAFVLCLGGASVFFTHAYMDAKKNIEEREREEAKPTATKK